ncbi:MAG: phage tail assembly protein [Xanthomonadaceae bacterium]|nr:phage tail assembly protein [Xanthomonadaceae bacterium]
MSEAGPAPALVEIVPLSKPLRDARGVEVMQLTLRRPTVRDLRQCGTPIVYLPGGYRIDDSAMANLISVCAGVPLPQVDEMELADFRAAGAVMLGFLGGI